ncbi:MAG: hypothetical protein WC480_01315 [Patescibacteria group bacterium]
MLAIIATNIYLFILAVVLAILEIQIEGSHGWAKNLPTWRPSSAKWYVRWYQKIMGGKECTGYHLALFGFIFLFFHSPYFFGAPLTLESWLETLSLYFMFMVVWDFLWFVFNPDYPIKKFKKEHIWWHRRWWWLAPVEYYFGFLISFLVLLPIVNLDLFYWWLTNFGLFFVESLVVIIFTLFIIKIDDWRK